MFILLIFILLLKLKFFSSLLKIEVVISIQHNPTLHLQKNMNKGLQLELELEFACSPRVCVGFLRYFGFLPHAKKKSQVNRATSQFHF